LPDVKICDKNSAGLKALPGVKICDKNSAGLKALQQYDICCEMKIHPLVTSLNAVVVFQWFNTLFLKMEWKLHLFKLYNHIACLSSSVWFMFPLLL
jgi:hypothetical protein